MQRTNKKNSTYMGMAFLFLSLAITPISLKSAGISQNLLAGVDAWRQISSVFSDSIQPATSSELLALNNLNSGAGAGANGDSEIPQSLVAQSQVESAAASEPRTSDVDLQPASSDREKRCPKSALRPSRVAGRGELAAVVNTQIRVHAQMIEAAARPEVIIDKEVWKSVRNQLALRRFEIGDAVKILPVSDMKVMVKLKELNIALPHAIPNCDVRKTQPARQVREARLRAIRAQDESSSPSAPENCEL
ncbi:MAG TPA: hypothetical protein VJZ26_06935 [Blastocatellia bacterium]|nr:hypothetical protein [Blastocatellia bacterium]